MTDETNAENKTTEVQAQSNNNKDKLQNNKTVEKHTNTDIFPNMKRRK